MPPPSLPILGHEVWREIGLGRIVQALQAAVDLRLMRGVLVFALGFSLAGCAAVQPPPAAFLDPAQAPLEGRFSVQLTDPQGQVQAWQGSFRWFQLQDQARADFVSPLGAQLAQLQITSNSARLIDAQGRIWQDHDPDALMQQVTGVPMPVRSLMAWLEPRSTSSAPVIDAQGWRVESLQTAPDRRRIQAHREDSRGTWRVRVLLP